MQNISAVLNAIFLTEDSMQIISDMMSENPKFFVRNIDKKRFSHQLIAQGYYSTLDQNEALINVLSSKWMKADKTSPDLRFSNENTIFNVLLHFSKDILTLENNKPCCHYEHLLSWHILATSLNEDTLVCSYLAAKDLRFGINRQEYTWKPFVQQDNKPLNNLLEKPLSDIHNHLNGSSLNFDLCWLCLMNNIVGRSKEFEELKLRQYTKSIIEDGNTILLSWYSLIIKAAAIRWYLFTRNRDISSQKDNLLFKILKEKNELLLLSYAIELQDQINVSRNLYGKEFTFLVDDVEILDYAIPHSQEGLFSVLAGERYFLYGQFQSIYEGDQHNVITETLLYAYLSIKLQFRQEIVQSNETVGFANFSLYEKRKEAFIHDESPFHKLIPQMAVGEFMKGKTDRYMETRLAPKDNLDKLRSKLVETDRYIRNVIYDKEADKWNNYNYVYHFIKKEEKLSKSSILYCRHYHLRQEIEKQARSIYALRNANIGDPFKPLHTRVVGIDAANSEIYARPEVFAHAFRYLYKHPCSNELITKPQDLGMTYHVGEDFMDVVDGLRAVDEVLHYMNFGNGCRLGHALVLGTNVAAYYNRRNKKIVLSKQDILDNVSWLWMMTNKIGVNNTNLFLQTTFEKYFREVFSSCFPVLPSIYSYYQSWLLRGDSPRNYQSVGVDISTTISVDPWQRTALCNHPDAMEARNNPDAVLLYYLYHYDKGVKTRSKEYDEIQVDEGFVEAVQSVQEYMLNTVNRLQIAIECNPTSNYKIGEISRYDEHPILKFNNEGLNVPYAKQDISVSINTDDKGVFATSLEREYALMALALEKQKQYGFENTPNSILSWLDRIREMGEVQRF